jgi:sugar O-acyltransferase (sialic acid O-acetyltransferase NeuD family)
MSGIFVVGAGGHAKVVAEILQARGDAIHGFLDDNPDVWGATRVGLPVLGSLDSLAERDPAGIIIGVGSNQSRNELAERLERSFPGLLVNAVHPSAVVSPSAALGRGVVVAAGAVINADTVIGDHVIINTGATVDHDCVVESFAHVAPGANVAGGVRIGEGSLIGVGACVIPNTVIGEWSVVGAGAAVVDDVPSRCTVAGVPARIIG